ncbi:MAG: PAC2 family protein [Propionibacteriaceae bacterium]|nr:PAC2 family protein [Propionibacteriaceae bacterium]
MLDPRTLYTLDPQVGESVLGTRPPLLHFLDGYIDSGQVAHVAAKYVLEQCEHEELARFDVDQLHDFRSRRPHFVFDTNHWDNRIDFELVLHKARDAAGKTFLMLRGPEPDTQWGRAAAAVIGLCREFDVAAVATAYGVPMAVPHTRPTLITQHATSPEIVSGNPMWIDSVTVPGSFSHMIEYEAGQAGLLGMGFVAHVPHYLAQSAFPQAVSTALGRINQACGLDIPLEPLRERAKANLDDINSEAASADAEFATLLSALEEQYDRLRESGAASVPSADEIGAAVEQFLAEQDQGGFPAAN